jgi:hypothetical protein
MVAPRLAEVSIKRIVPTPKYVAWAILDATPELATVAKGLGIFFISSNNICLTKSNTLDIDVLARENIS